MSRESVWVNNDGLEVGFGPVVGDNIKAGGNHTKGKTKELEMRIDVAGSGLYSVGDQLSTKHQGIPAGAYIQSARLVMDVDFDNAVEVGTAQLDGTAIDQDGLVATGTTTAEGAGALIGTVTSEINYLVITATTTAPTVGEGYVVVEYII